MKILAIGDVVGPAAIEYLSERLWNTSGEVDPDSFTCDLDRLLKLVDKALKYFCHIPMLQMQINKNHHSLVFHINLYLQFEINV